MWNNRALGKQRAECERDRSLCASRPLCSVLLRAFAFIIISFLFLARRARILNNLCKLGLRENRSVKGNNARHSYARSVPVIVRLRASFFSSFASINDERGFQMKRNKLFCARIQLTHSNELMGFGLRARYVREGVLSEGVVLQKFNFLKSEAVERAPKDTAGREKATEDRKSFASPWQFQHCQRDWI